MVNSGLKRLYLVGKGLCRVVAISQQVVLVCFFGLGLEAFAG
jgi:hypothetical protein